MTTPQAGPGFSVDLEYVRGTIQPLRDSLIVAKQVWKDHEKMIGELDNVQQMMRVGKAAEHFLYRWGHAMRVIVEDGEKIAAALSSVVLQYDVADAVAKGLMIPTPGPTPDTVQYVVNPNPPISAMSPERLAQEEARGSIVRAQTVSLDGKPVYIPNPSPPPGVTPPPAKPVPVTLPGAPAPGAGR
ncbi:MAG: hypothetical protein HOV68_06570 [Streptomycetaceae bacterium]|nr:hypothetical protein [Streptomycetaceae bacterium]